MKMNVPLKEAERCVEKVKERNMGYLFANMEKMDIQEERRKTAEARKAAEEAKMRAEEAKLQAEEAKAQAKEATMQANEAEHRAKETRNEAIKNTILLCRELGASKETAVQKLTDLYSLEPEAAREAVVRYWEKL